MNPFIRNFAASRHFLLILLLTGCGTPAERQVRQTLRCAEEVLAEHPDSALTLLTPLDSVSLAGEEQAWYAVLRTQAVYKLLRPVTDSLPLLATAYYGTPRRPHYRAAMAWYSLGCVYTDHNDDPRAIDAYLKARDLFPDTLCRYYALTEQNLGIRYLNSCDYLNAIRMLQCFRADAVALSDSDLVGYADYFLGKSYMQYANYENAVGYYMMVLENNEFTSKYKIETLFQLAKIKHWQGEDKEAMAYTEQYIDKVMKSPPPCAAFYLKGDIFYNSGIYDSAHFYYRKALDGCYDLGTLCCTYEKLTKLTSIYDTDSLESYSDKHTLYRDSIYNSDRTAEIGQIRARHQIDFKLQQAEYEKNRLVILLSAAALMLLLLFLFLYTRADRRRKQEQLRLMQQLRAKEVEIMELNALLPADRSRLLALYQQEAAVCRSLALSQEGVRRLAIGRNKAQSLSVQERDALLAAVRESYVTLFQKVHSDGTILSEQDRDICALSHLQISTRDIAEMLSMAEETVRTHKHRMKQKLDSDLFQLFFEKA